jgi:hypothetical protein
MEYFKGIDTAPYKHISPETLVFKANSQSANEGTTQSKTGGPGRIRTGDQQVMSLAL